MTAPAPAPAGRGGPDGPPWVSDGRHHDDPAHVTPPLRLAPLPDGGMEMSAGPLNHRLTEGHDAFHQEQAALQAAGWATSSSIQADATGARHPGQNGDCTSIGNERWAWLARTDTQSRVHFLERLQAERRDEVNAAALAYRAERGGAAGHGARRAARPVVRTEATAWTTHRRRNLIDGPRAGALATEGALIGGLAAPGFNRDLGGVSDDAGPFDRFVPGRCGVPAERPWSHRIPRNEPDRRAIAWVRPPVWFLYRDLKADRQAPDPAAKDRITAGFQARCATETTGEPLHAVLRGLPRNQAELLRVRERPDWPIHHHRRETALRDRVKKRHLSAGTRSEDGRRCRDPFASLRKTCRKQGLSFWEYLKDRGAGLNLIPSLAELIRRPVMP